MGSSVKNAFKFSGAALNPGYLLLNGAKNAPGGSRIPGISQQNDQILYGLENNLLSYEDLIRTGRLQPGQNPSGLLPGQSRYGRDIGSMLDSFSSADPAFAAYRSTVASGLEGLNGPDGLPSDYKRTLLEDLRSSQASRGIIDSDTAAIEEAVRLSGGRETIRAQRLSEVQNYLSGAFNMAAGAIVPSIGQMLQGSSTSYGQNLQRTQGVDNIRAGYVHEAGDLLSSGLGALTGFLK